MGTETPLPFRLACELSELRTHPAAHDVPEGCRGRVCLDGVLAGMRQGHLEASVKERRPADRGGSLPSFPADPPRSLCPAPTMVYLNCSSGGVLQRMELLRLSKV